MSVPIAHSMALLTLRNSADKLLKVADIRGSDYTQRYTNSYSELVRLTLVGVNVGFRDTMLA